MKKIFTLIATALVAVSASAQVQAVDLGLSVKWGDRYVGASDVQTPGDYYAYGETETKSDYSLANYVYNGYDFLTVKEFYGSAYFNTPTPAVKDVATEKLGAGWRMPTSAEFEELKACTVEALQLPGGGDCGIMKITGTNGNSITLCTTGYLYGTKTSMKNYQASFYLSDLAVISDTDYEPQHGEFAVSQTKYAGSSVSYSSYPFYGYCILPVYDESAAAIDNVTADAQAQPSARKYVKAGKLVIEKNGKQYNAAGALLK